MRHISNHIFPSKDTFKAKGDPLWAAYLAGWWDRGDAPDGYSPEDAKKAYDEWVEENKKNGIKADSSCTEEPTSSR